MTAFSRTPDVAQRCLRTTAGAALGIGLLLVSGASFAAQAAHATVFDRAEFVLSNDPEPARRRGKHAWARLQGTWPHSAIDVTFPNGSSGIFSGTRPALPGDTLQVSYGP